MERFIYSDLLNWKKQKKRKPLLVRGARQVGKSFVIKEFGETEFENLIVLNFERNPEYKEIFVTLEPKEIIEKITDPPILYQLELATARVSRSKTLSPKYLRFNL